MLRKILITSLFALLLIATPLRLEAQTENIKEDTSESNIPSVYMFSSPTCPHCTAAKNFLTSLQAEGEVVFRFEDYNLASNVELADEYYEHYSVPAGQRGLVPAIFVGDEYFIGYNESVGEEIKNYLISQEKKSSGLTRVPILGEIDLYSFSLPALAITLGIVDGFNVCSLGALIIILGLVMVLGSRKRIILMGGAFLLTAGLVYALLIFLWHQFFAFIAPFIRSMEILIGSLSIIGGIYLLYEFYKAYKSGPVCSSNNIMSRLTPKIEKIFKNKTNWLVLLSSVMLFALVVTVVEFPCSAFLPVLFASILVDSGVSFQTSVGYIGLYMLFYLLDELIIFAIAVWTMRIKIVSPKFIIFFNLLAALIFIFLGGVYIFGWLA